MTEQDLLGAVMEHYFAEWEMETAQATLERKGMDAAIEFLRKVAVESSRGAGGPSMVS